MQELHKCNTNMPSEGASASDTWASVSVNSLSIRGLLAVFHEMDLLFLWKAKKICVGYEWEYVILTFKMQNSNNELRTTLETV